MNKDDEINSDEEQEQGWVSKNMFVIWVLY
jgi:hypothetical protein